MLVRCYGCAVNNKITAQRINYRFFIVPLGKIDAIA